MSDSSIIPERQLVFSPALAQTIGLEEAILLQHLSELFKHRESQEHRGYAWLRVQREWLLETLPFWSAVDLHRVTKSLTDKGLILVESPPLHEAEALVFAINESRATERQAARAATPQQPYQPPRRQGAGLLAAAWAPSEDLLQLLALNHGISRQFALEQLEDFVCYWRERGEVSHAWENKYRQHVLSRWRQSQQDTGERFRPSDESLSDNWYPSEDALEILERTGVTRAFIDDAVPEFVLYWRERNPQEKALNSKFIQHIRRQWARYTSALTHDTEPTRIPEDWRPTEDVYDILRMSHIDPGFAEGLLPEFIIYWRDSNKLYKSWNTKFLQHVKYHWARRNELATHGQQQDPYRTGRTRDRSLAEDLNDRSWAS
ncbi:MAG: DnaT-like ssDNA-binding domain-containing protein [Halieaceae bacterium]|nr:DnaT-like ssDNA-binding domain-containing protein [Halieaceae bacterium]